MIDSPIEIPQAVRDMSERSLKQAHAEYENLTDFVTKAMGIWMGVMPANPIGRKSVDLSTGKLTAERMAALAQPSTARTAAAAIRVSNAKLFSSENQ